MITGKFLRIGLYVLLVAVASVLAGFLFLQVPPLLQDLAEASAASRADARRYLELIVRTGLAQGTGGDLQAQLIEASALPSVAGIVVADSTNRIVAGAWEGEALTDLQAFEKTASGGWERWLLEDVDGRSGFVNLALVESAVGDLGERMLFIAGVAGGGLMVIVLLVAGVFRSHANELANNLGSAISRLADGDFTARMPDRRTGAGGRLAASFNRMVHAVDSSTRRLRDSEQRFDLAVNGSSDGIWDWNIQNNRLYLSPRFTAMLGYRGRELPGMFNAWKRLIHPDDEPAFSARLEQHLGANAPFRVEMRLKARDGRWSWILVRGQAVRNDENTPVRMVGSCTDISDLKVAQQALADAEQRARVTLESIIDGVITTDEEGRIKYMNPAAEHTIGWSAERAAGMSLIDVLSIPDEFAVAALQDALNAVLHKQRQPIELAQIEIIPRDGERQIVEPDMAPVRDSNGVITGCVFVIHNVTEHHKLMRQLSHQARHDPLTQLINRYTFEARLEEALAAAQQDESLEQVVCYMDMDQFKIVNDTSGHSAGDELLRQFAALIQDKVRKDDTLARLGGDEFGLLLHSCSLENARKIAENIRRAVEDFRFTWKEKTFSVSISIGIAPIVRGHGSVAELLTVVDQACYIAKNKGRNQVHIHVPGDMESARWGKEMQWVPRIHRALDEERFLLFAQPILPVNSVSPTNGHYEILLRMKSDFQKIVSPGAFLPAAERYGLMPTIDRWVVRNAVEMLATALENNPSLQNKLFSINMSGTVLGDDGFLSHVKNVLDEFGLPPDLLCFEITETVAIANFSLATRFVNELKGLGCEFALDDFGSGFASFGNLKSLPVDYLKIDGSFVRPAMESPIDLAMVEVINHIGHIMKLKTIAEFVENEETLKALRKIGVDYAQGYHLGKPVPLFEICYGE